MRETTIHELKVNGIGRIRWWLISVDLHIFLQFIAFETEFLVDTIHPKKAKYMIH